MKHYIDEHALNKLIIDYEPMVMSIIKRLNILYDIEDYMQIGRAAVHQAVTTYDENAAHGATLPQFVYTRVHQRMIDEIRKTSRYTSNVEVTEDAHNGIGFLFSNEDNHIALIIQEVKGVLNKKELAWFEMMLDGYSVAEISLVLGFSMSTVKNIRKSARIKIKTLI